MEEYTLICQGFSKRDQYIRNAIERAAKTAMDKLERKLSIPVKCSRRALGVVDPTGTLPPGSVFFQYTSKDSYLPQLITGKVAVTRNPCYHPGDVRVLEATACPALSHLVDVLVFPRVGNFRPHSDGSFSCLLFPLHTCVTN
jgi:RNA-dependent RNA polymerase